MLFTTQYPKSIPPVIRSDTDTWVLFKFASKERVIDQVYNEISSLLTIEDDETHISHHKILSSVYICRCVTCSDPLFS